MIAPHFVTAPDGLIGFDANQHISPVAAATFRAKGYRFAVRYVRRDEAHAYDLTAQEARDIIANGLGLMLVQHVAHDGWIPTPQKGAQYGNTAAIEAFRVGAPPGTMLWCDLEGTGPTLDADVIGFCNNWFDYVSRAGFTPGLYVGYAPGLSAEQLYYKLKFTHYWSAYNLNKDQYPAVRGVQMEQRAAKPSEWIAGFTNQNLDVNTTHADKLGGRVVLLTMPGWRP